MRYWQAKVGATLVWILSISSVCIAAEDSTSKQIQMLNSQIQVQLQKLQETQQKQIKDLNVKLQAQLQQMQTNLEAEIQKANTQNQAQFKQIHDNINQLQKKH
jgi:mRNA-degrading endonuclease RelE of RelBE toxin-antitoxin system